MVRRGRLAPPNPVLDSRQRRIFPTPNVDIAAAAYVGVSND